MYTNPDEKLRHDPMLLLVLYHLRAIAKHDEDEYRNRVHRERDKQGKRGAGYSAYNVGFFEGLLLAATGTINALNEIEKRLGIRDSQ